MSKVTYHSHYQMKIIKAVSEEEQLKYSYLIPLGNTQEVQRTVFKDDSDDANLIGHYRQPAAIASLCVTPKEDDGEDVLKQYIAAKRKQALAMAITMIYYIGCLFIITWVVRQASVATLTVLMVLSPPIAVVAATLTWWFVYEPAKEKADSLLKEYMKTEHFKRHWPWDEYERVMLWK